MGINFNGKITEYEAACAQATGTAKAYGDAILKLLSDIRDSVSATGPEDKVLSYRGTTNTLATGANDPNNGTIVPGTMGTVCEVPSGQQVTLKHLAISNTAAANVQLFLDGRIICGMQSTSNSPELNIVIGPGRLQIVSSVDSTDYFVQMRQITPDKTKVNDAFAGRQPNAGLMTGGFIDPERHFDSNRIDVHHDGARRS